MNADGNVTTSAPADAIVIPEPDADSEIAQLLAALVVALDDVAQNAARTAESKHAAELAALAPLAANPIIAEAILKLENESAKERANAADHARFITRKQYGEIFAQLDAYGRPPVVVTGKPGKTNGAPKSGATPITDADGNVYVKTQPPVATYTVTGKRPCGTCPISQYVIPRAPATAGDDAIALPNFRQNSTKRLAEMSRADVIAHADCFDALSDAEASYPHTATVTRYALATA
jgi:hypothetical protein